MIEIIAIAAIITIGAAFVKESGSGTGKAITITICAALLILMLL